MRVVVTGLVATYPVGGVAWDYLQYVEGFARLGCAVTYLEDTGQWLYDPTAGTFTADPRFGAGWLAAHLARLAPSASGGWALRSPYGALLGMDEAALARTCAEADLFLNLSGSCALRELYRAARVLAYVDTDPGYSQAKLATAAAGTADVETLRSAALIRAHQVFFTLGEHVGAADCRVPACGITWHPTRQPIVLDAWPVVPAPADAAFTSVLSWAIEPSPPVVDGVRYGGKDVELLRMLDLPRHVGVSLELAVSGEAPRDRLLAAGWRVIDGHQASATPAAYRAYLQGSRGECGIAKNTYVGLRTGWFATRSAAYLASGRPVVLQDTGFPAHVPTGPGLHAFRDVASAAAALDAVCARPADAAAHARSVAETWFRAEDVCARILRDAGLG